LRVAGAFALLLAQLADGAAFASGSGNVPIPGAQFESALPEAPGLKTTVAPFRLDVSLVSNADFARFVRAHPEWRRGAVAPLLADTGYLQHWANANDPGKSSARKPVTQVSWFAANAYCEARGSRLPSWHEWELAAAASDAAPDARNNPAWQQRILDWYSTSARGVLPDAGASPPNYYGVRDLHGVAWEWVLDAGSMTASDSNQFCGSGALSVEQKENYAVMMRIAMLSSMKASYTSGSMGFRCATDVGTRR
jgi:sulfatase modifying factor 1